MAMNVNIIQLSRFHISDMVEHFAAYVLKAVAK